MRYQVVKATKEHAEIIASHMRPGDLAECETTHGGPVAAIEDSLNRSTMAWTWLVDGVPAVIGGVCIDSIVGAHAYPWMLTTSIVDQNKIAFSRMTRRFKNAVKDELRLNIEAYIDVRYLKATKWADWLGLKVEDPVVYNGTSFCKVH